MKVIIVEDDAIVADHLKLMLQKHAISVLKIVKNVTDAISAMVLSPDLYFVDIRLIGEETGIDLGIELNEKKIPFIYVTANNEISTVRKAAKSSPLAYITKPYKEGDIIALIEIFKTRHEQTFSVKTRYGKKQIKLSNILYFQASGSYVDVVMNDTEYKERTRLSILESLYSEKFIRVHRSYLVNKEEIQQYNSKYVFINDISIPISRIYKDEVIRQLKDSFY